MNGVFKVLNYRIVLERAFWGHLVQAPCNEQGHLQPEQILQSPIQPDPGGFQGWCIYQFAGQPVPVPHMLNIKDSFQISCLTLSSFRSEPPCLVLLLQALLYLHSCIYIWTYTWRISNLNSHLSFKRKMSLRNREKTPKLKKQILRTIVPIDAGINTK